MLLTQVAFRFKIFSLVLMILLSQITLAGMPWGDHSKPVVRDYKTGYRSEELNTWPAWLRACDSLNRILSAPLTAGNMCSRWQPSYAKRLEQADKKAVDNFIRGYFFIEANPEYSVRDPNIRVYQAYESITFKEGFQAALGDEFYTEIVSNNNNSQVPAPSNNTGATNSDMNWVIARSFDENGNVINEGKQFFDQSGQPLQAQSKVRYRIDPSNTVTHVFANQTIKDAMGRDAVTTMTAPIDNSEFAYKADFVQNSNGTAYDYKSFDQYNGSDKTNNPDPVGGQNVPGTLGWYYSKNNNWEPYTPTTDYPYSRQSYYNDGAGSVKKTAGAGEQFIMGSNHEVSSYTTPVINELDHYLQVRNKLFSAGELGAVPTKLEYEAVQTVSKDANARLGITIQDKSGKTLMVGRPGTELAVTNTAIIKEGNIYYFRTFAAGSVIISDAANELYNLETDQQLGIGTGGTIGAGYYKLVNRGSGDITLTYSNGYADVSYSFYNQLGQLVATIAPEGVKKLYGSGLNNYTAKNDMPFITLFEYDVQGRLRKSNSVDGGTVELVYRTDGKIRFSQNAEQKTNGRYSYTNYDGLGRVIETGEYKPDGNGIAFNSDLTATINPMRDILDNTSSTGGLTSGDKMDVVTTLYDIVNDSYSNTNYLQNAEFLGGAISMTRKYSIIVNNTPDNNNLVSSTWYNYDEEGKVTWMIQYIKGLGYKTTDYAYDVMGRLEKREYQKGGDDMFVHYYEYDITTQKLYRVYTGNTSNAADKKLQATYIYYLHGQLKRIVLGDNMQGLDYTYTLQGALKAINNSDKSMDPGNDGNNGVNADAFGEVLDYYQGDYTNSRANGVQSLIGVSTGVGQNSYAGNIKAMTWFSRKPSSVVGSIPGVEDPTSYVYEYDDKYQFTESTWGSGVNFTDYNKEKIKLPGSNAPAYDANGNMLYLLRTKPTGALENRFTYNYLNTTTNSGSNTNYNSNKLESVVDDAGGTPKIYASYMYDMLGQLKVEKDETGAVRKSIKYDVTGKVTMVERNAGEPLVEYVYNELGKRIIKKSYNASHQLSEVTYYVGSVIYTQTVTGGATYGNIVAQEYEVRSTSGRLGTYYRQSDIYAYELNDHLGNVRAVVAKSGSTMEVRMYADYYPYGMRIRGVDGYRYGYQGQYSEKDGETGWNAFELRMHDSKIGRWLSVDPAKQYPSPYLSMGNNPTTNTDPTGGVDVYFDKNGNYTETKHDNWWHTLWFGYRGRILDDNGGITQRFRFASGEDDVNDIKSGIINKIIFVKEAEIISMLSRSGVFTHENKTGNNSAIDMYDYILREGQGGGRMDFSFNRGIPEQYRNVPGVSFDPQSRPSSVMFFVDGLAHNHMNFGNFLFGAAGNALGHTKYELLVGAHYNSRRNRKNGYDSQMDSADDQMSIRAGYTHGYLKNYYKYEYRAH